MSLRTSQLALRLDATAVSPSRRWQDGDSIAFLGGTLTLRLATDVEASARRGDELHLPLPPQASERQIQDSAEAWLRREAEQLFTNIITRHTAAAGNLAPKLQLSFAAKGGWTDVEPATRTRPGKIRCNWRLIEQAPESIEQVLASALAAVQTSSATPDLFGSVAL
ncbi:MAG: DUF45 domain-containing protein [Rhodocyclaceae bacterium]|jgi:predicted metal-dependent hydrolase|nr:DUF45 domain-containing protein [Rhodocyclaceae bacterium]MBK6908450.1 DUF45 domain-containing protein [Rhodocyclaceae bacterium]